MPYVQPVTHKKDYQEESKIYIDQNIQPAQFSAFAANQEEQQHDEHDSKHHKVQEWITDHTHKKQDSNVDFIAHPHENTDQPHHVKEWILDHLHSK